MMIKRTSLVSLFALFFVTLAVPAGAGEPKIDDLSAFLEPLRVKYKLPALAAAVIKAGKLDAAGAVGVRRFGSEERVTLDDKFHLGSCTKAITATLIARLVEAKKLTWDTTPADVFPELSEGMHKDFRSVTLRHLLNHRAGLPGESAPKGMVLWQVHALPGSPRDQRLAYTKLMLANPPAYPAGSKYVYSNAGFAIAGAMAEQVTDTPWETLLADQIFGPLGITSFGFGAMGTRGKIEQPWQHHFVGDVIVPIRPGPRADNPPAIGPAGTVHMTVLDWAKFVSEHLHEGKAKNSLLKRSTYQTIHHAPFGGDYAFGWVVAPRKWADGDAITHAGSNNSNYAVVWAAPKRDFAILVMTNIAGGNVAVATDEVVAALIRKPRK